MLFTIQEAQDLLGVDQKTLRKWMKRSEIEPIQDAVDQRRRLINEDQLKLLARVHRRDLRLDSSSGLAATVRTLQHQVSQLQQQVTALNGQLAHTSSGN